MSDLPPAAPPTPTGAVPEPPAGCPINAEFLPPNMRKHVDPKAPAALRMMAAKTLVPLSPSDMVGALYMLTFDSETGIKEAADKSSRGLPDRILSTALRDEGIKAPVLGHFLDLHFEKDTYAEMLILNPTTPDEAIARAAKGCSAKTAEIIGQNQLRILRHDDIIRQLCANPSATPALIDSVCDFAVRSGVTLVDVPQMKEARIRLFGPEAVETVVDPSPTADQVMEEYAELAEESAAPLEEGKRLTLSQRVMKMNIAEKIKLATKGNKEARSLLIRDSNKLVCTAVIRSPRITDGEVLMCANNRAINDDVLRIIYTSREFTKAYPVKLALVKNPKTPSGIAMKFLNTLRESEIKDLARNKNVPSAIQMMAKKTMDKKNAPKKEDK
ncbi:MAG: hypothetical protein ACT4TC_10185 [Myxococcaceae bacterium]